MTRKTVRDYETALAQLEADIRATANRVSIDGDLTPEGKRHRHQKWAQQYGWADQLDATANGLLDTLNAAHDKAAQARAAMTTLPTGEAALAQEMRMNRRMKRIEAALNAGGTGPLLDLIATADDAELPFLLEHINDHHEAIGGDQGNAGAQIVEQALRDRNPDYDAAARVAGQAANALTVAREKVEYVSKLLDDPATPPPGEYSLAAMSVDVAGPDVGDLAA